MGSLKLWRRFSIVVATLIVATFAIGGAAGAKSGNNATFTIVATSVEFSDIEGGFTFLDEIETTDGVAIDGWDGGHCINLAEDEGALTQWMCHLVVHLPEGDIVASGSFDLTSPTIVFAVTGGTGDFVNARGELEVVPIDELSSFAHFRLLGATAKY